MLYHLKPSANFYGLEIPHGIFGGLVFGPGIFWGVLLEALGISLGFDRRHLKSRVSPALGGGGAYSQEALV